MRNIVRDIIDYVKVNHRLELLQQEKFGEDNELMLFITRDISNKSVRKQLDRALAKTHRIEDQMKNEEITRNYLQFCLHHPFRSENVDPREFENAFYEDIEEELLAKPTSHEDYYLD